MSSNNLYHEIGVYVEEVHEEHIWRLSLHTRRRPCLVQEVAQVHRYNDLRTGSNRGCQNVAIVGIVGHAVDEGLESLHVGFREGPTQCVNQSLRPVLIGQTVLNQVPPDFFEYHLTPLAMVQPLSCCT